LDKALKNILVKDGYVFLNKYMLNKTTSELVESLETKEDLEPISKIHHLTPKTKAESTPNTYSGQYGRHDFPMHTDLAHWPKPPRYLLLRCIQGNNQVSTRLLDGNKIVNKLGTRVLERALVKPRRPINGKIRLMRIFQSGTPSLFRWDETFIVPASPAGSIGVSAVINALKETNITNVVLENTSDTLLIDNWRMLHGRSAIPDGGDGRIIERVYLGDKT
jgi:hypothetical protein